VELAVSSRPFLSGFDVVSVPADDWLEAESCILCGSCDLLDVIVVSARDAVGSIVSFCTVCEHGFRRRRPAPHWFDTYYQSAWDRAGRSDLSRRARPNRKALVFASELFEGARTVLDVGAGFGDALVAFAEAGFEVEGLERSEHRARFVREQLHLPCATTPLEAVEGVRRYDVVHIHHVLEHMDDPRIALAHAASAVTDGGLLYVAVPNWRHEHPPQAAYFVPHLSLFSRRSLDLALREAALVPLRWSEGVELQVVARRMVDDGKVTAGRELQAELQRWVSPAFGPLGTRTLLWWKARRRELLYESAWTPLPTSAVRRLTALSGRLPSGLRRPVQSRWQWLGQPTLRALRVRVIGEQDVLPARLRQATDARVWIK
jgi:SAM-dependent methyltransferase